MNKKVKDNIQVNWEDTATFQGPCDVIRFKHGACCNGFVAGFGHDIGQQEATFLGEFLNEHAEDRALFVTLRQ